MATAIDMMTKKEVASDLLSLKGVSRGLRPAGINRSRIVLSGKPGTGKSTLIRSNPKAIILDFEDSGRTVASPESLRFGPDPESNFYPTADEYRKFIDQLIARRAAGKTDIDMVGVDSFDKMVECFSRDLCQKNKLESVGDYGGGHGKGYWIVRDEISTLLDQLYRAGYGWVLISHIVQKSIKDGENERLISSLSVSDTFKSFLWQNCEHMFFMDRDVKVVESAPEVRTVNGKQVTLPKKSETVKVRCLKTSPGGLWSGGITDDVKVRLPFDDNIQVPLKGGWQAVESAFDVALKRLIGS